MRKRLAVVSILLLLVSACSRPGGAAEQSEDGTIHVTLALSSLTILLGLPLIAQDHGLFEKNGLKVDEVVANSAADAVNITLSGDADFVMTAAPAVFSLNGEGQAVQFLANAYSGLAASVVMDPDVAKRTGVSPDAPIEDRLKALNGLHMSFASPSSGYLTVIESAMKLVKGAVDPVFIEQASMPAALKQHKIDVLIASPPVSDIAVRDGGTLWISGPEGDLPDEVQPPMTTAAAATKRFIDANPEAAERFVKSLQDAAKFVESDPDAAGRLLEKRFPELDKDLFDASWNANKTAFSHVGLDAKLLDQQRNTLAADELTPEVKALNMQDLLCPCAPKP